MKSLKMGVKLNISPSQLLEYGFMLFVILLALVLRGSLFSIHTNDYDHYLSKWYDFIQSHGGFSALKYNFADYNVPYLYLLVIATYIPVSKIVIIKSLSVFFDLILALFTYLIVKLKYEKSYLPIIAAFVVLFIPTAVLNSAMWGQSDSIYTAFSVGGIYFLLRKKLVWAFTFFGLAISFKIQAIFLFPLLFVLLITAEVRLRYFLIIPLVYFITLIPAHLAGRSLGSLLSIYILQSAEYGSTLTLNAPNIFQWITAKQPTIWNNAGIILTIVVIALLSFVVLTRHKKITETLIIKLSFIFVLIVPFLLPHMHERYFYMADIISISYAFYVPKHWYETIFVPIASLLSYVPYLFGVIVVDLRYVALLMLLAIVIAMFDFARDLYAL